MPTSGRLFFIFLLIGLAVAGCFAPAPEFPGGQLPPSDEPPAAEVTTPQPVPEEPASYDEVLFHPVMELEPFLSQNGLRKSARLVVQDPQAWAMLWSQIVSHTSPQPPLPTVDFNRERLIVTAMGQRASSGYTITITNVQRSGDILYVSVREVSPGNDCGTSDEITYPLAAVRVPAGRESVLFRESTGVQNCADLAP